MGPRAATSSESAPSTLTARRAHWSTTPNHGAYLGCGLHVHWTLNTGPHSLMGCPSTGRHPEATFSCLNKDGAQMKQHGQHMPSPCRCSGGAGAHWVSRYQATSVRMEM